jgi:hypothetical protein
LKKASINGKNDLTLFLMWELWEFEQLWKKKGLGYRPLEILTVVGEEKIFNHYEQTDK